MSVEAEKQMQFTTERPLCHSHLQNYRLPNYQILPGLSVVKQAAILVRFHGATDD
jgi:hypothetical protein